ncbi:NAD-dependent epimerase/dehydratase family protein [Cupriavidus basilensis]
MSTLVTGGKGFIGARLVRRLVEQGERVICLDLKGRPGRLADIAERITFVEGDVSCYEDIENVLRRHDITRIAHSVFFSAEERGVAARPEDAELLYRQQMVMTTGTFHLFEAARRASIRRVLYPSSVQYHGLDEPWTEAVPVTEQSPARPTSPYGISKHLCERLAHEYNRLHGMEIVSIRVSGAYGPGARFGARGISPDRNRRCARSAGRLSLLPCAASGAGPRRRHRRDLRPRVGRSKTPAPGLSRRRSRCVLWRTGGGWSTVIARDGDHLPRRCATAM